MIAVPKPQRMTAKEYLGEYCSVLGCRRILEAIKLETFIDEHHEPQIKLPKLEAKIPTRRKKLEAIL